jgi:hypothetical protein
VLGDREVHADVTGDELLQLLAYRRHQRRVGAEVLRARQRIVAAGARELGLAFRAHHGLAERLSRAAAGRRA